MVNEIKNNIIGPRSNDEKINFNPKNEYFARIEKEFFLKKAILIHIKFQILDRKQMQQRG